MYHRQTSSCPKRTGKRALPRPHHPVDENAPANRWGRSDHEAESARTAKQPLTPNAESRADRLGPRVTECAHVLRASQTRRWAARFRIARVAPVSARYSRTASGSSLRSSRRSWTDLRPDRAERISSSVFDAAPARRSSCSSSRRWRTDPSANPGCWASEARASSSRPPDLMRYPRAPSATARSGSWSI